MNKTQMNMRFLIATHEHINVLVEHNLKMALETEQLELDEQTVKKGVQAVLDSTDKGFYLVAVDDHQVAGSLLITYEWSDWRNAHMWWFQSVFVKDEYRGKGVFRGMYERITEMAAEAGVKVLRLYVEQENVPAQQVYKKLGMHPSHYLMYETDVD